MLYASAVAVSYDRLPALQCCTNLCATGMGSFTAVGGIKSGEKTVTAFESADCAIALAIARFKSYAKPGGSDYVVSHEGGLLRSRNLILACGELPNVWLTCPSVCMA